MAGHSIWERPGWNNGPDHFFTGDGDLAATPVIQGTYSRACAQNRHLVEGDVQRKENPTHGNRRRYGTLSAAVTDGEAD